MFHICINWYFSLIRICKPDRNYTCNSLKDIGKRIAFTVEIVNLINILAFSVKNHRKSFVFSNTSLDASSAPTPVNMTPTFKKGLWK